MAANQPRPRYLELILTIYLYSRLTHNSVNSNAGASSMKSALRPVRTKWQCSYTRREIDRLVAI